jgi:hypothetical protein
MSTSLRVVAASAKSAAAAATTSLSERIQRLQAEARGLAREHIDSLRASLMETQALAAEIARGGDAYPPGAREIAGRLCEDSAAKALTLEAIMARL